MSGIRKTSVNISVTMAPIRFVKIRRGVVTIEFNGITHKMKEGAEFIVTGDWSGVQQ